MLWGETCPSWFQGAISTQEGAFMPPSSIHEVGVCEAPKPVVPILFPSPVIHHTVPLLHRVDVDTIHDSIGSHMAQQGADARVTLKSLPFPSFIPSFQSPLQTLESGSFVTDRITKQGPLIRVMMRVGERRVTCMCNQHPIGFLSHRTVQLSSRPHICRVT